MKRKHLKEFFSRQYSLLKEQDEEDPFATDDAEEGGEEEGGEEEGGAEEADDAEEAADEDAGVEVDEEDEQRFKKSIDDQLQALLIDIESDAIKSAEVQKESFSLKQILLKEADGVSIDTDKFASEVARLILNFDAFVDLEGMLLAKVRRFLVDKHGEDIADDVENLLSNRHNIVKHEEIKKDEEEVDTQMPIAVGASGGAA